MARAAPSRYEQIGQGYAHTRREDPRLASRIHAGLGEARTVVNVGAGAGSYEPRDRHVIAIEPSDVMAAQRPPDRVPALRASAGVLPLRDASVAAAMAVLTVHHWDAEQERGVQELRRVARGPVVIVTFDPTVSGQMWLMRDYLPEVAELDGRIFPALGQLLAWLGGHTRVEVLELARDTPDWIVLGSPRARPRCRGSCGHVGVCPHGARGARARRAGCPVRLGQRRMGIPARPSARPRQLRRRAAAARQPPGVARPARGGPARAAAAQWWKAWRRSGSLPGIGRSRDSRNFVSSCRCSSSRSAISLVIPARTTIRSTDRSWRFSGKV
jgi:SAM-dependent methyltransferase